MWLLWVLIGIVAVVVWMFWAGTTLCPRCGLELTRDIMAPWQRTNSCRCGWREGSRP